ncbi:GNAT family N-acetyltransferase [Ferrimonas marina]|uniref:ElaA protein n=1 Tax=Ferrimonas marina TaxID=299255 RepID=A0A1M5YBW5_9GAMM|nr:GNAT family N-acetyltransferase [Ferrimonas marina]SHI08993.1 ElaA protein [Ferrimonas marina]
MTSHNVFEVSWQWLPFQQLSVNQLYELLKLREQVFQLEQSSLYPDLDDKDQIAHHLLVTQNEQLIGYLRLIPTDSAIKLGRIVLTEATRGQALGRELVQAGIARALSVAPSLPITLSAQQALQSYYEDFGFRACSLPYDDGGVMHLDMVLPGSSQD